MLETTYQKTVALWQSYDIKTTADLELRLDSFRILFAYHSGKIENDEINYNDTREVFENGRVTSFAGTPRTLFEQQNQKTCYELLVPKIMQKEQLSVSLIKDIHAALTAGTYDERRYIENGERPGEFKKHDYVTGIHEVGSAPEDVETDLTELVEELDSLAVMSPEKTLKAAAYLHARFEAIHPFADGNGRVGRTLVNFYLMTHEHPPLIIYEEDRKPYYEALRTYDEKDEIDPLYEFFVYETEKTWTKTLGRANSAKQDREKSAKNLNDFVR